MSTNQLIHIGYHKTATSWFQKFLFNNVESGFVAVPGSQLIEHLVSPNALDFTSDSCQRKFDSFIADATSQGLIPVISHERLSGNPHSGGYDSRELADRLVKVFPTGRVLIVIREQKSMILSTYKQYVAEGGSCSIENYLKPPARGKSRIPLFDFNHFKYHRLISYYINLFGSDNVLVLPYELFKENPQSFTSKIVLFSNAKEIENLPYRVQENRGLSEVATLIKSRLNHVAIRDRLNPSATPIPGFDRLLLSPSLRILDSVLPQSWRESFGERVKQVISKMVGDMYKESNDRMGQMVNLDLKKYRYDLTD